MTELKLVFTLTLVQVILAQSCVILMHPSLTQDHMQWLHSLSQPAPTISLPKDANGIKNLMKGVKCAQVFANGLEEIGQLAKNFHIHRGKTTINVISGKIVPNNTGLALPVYYVEVGKAGKVL